MTTPTSTAASLPDPSPHPRSRDHIFISYSSKDRGFVDRLAEDLRSRGHTVWIDFKGIHGGEEWRQSIADGLHASAVVLAVLTPDSVISPWVEVELKTARDLKKPIIPLLLRPLDGITIPHPTIQYIYRDVHYRDFTRGYQEFDTLLDDLPRPASGVPGHCQKLIARLAALPWGLDHYIQEEARLLPLHASPYEDGVVKGQPENLMRRLWSSHRLIVLGEPGMGKTVALERLAWELASSDLPTVPVIVNLFEYHGEALLTWVHRKLIAHGEIDHDSEEKTRQFLKEKDKQRQPFDCYFLLDGLNEVRPEHRDKALSEITALALEFPRHPLVVTSRMQDDGWRTLRQGSAVTETYLVQRIHPPQAQAYLAAHLEARDGAALWDQLDERMCELATTPLLLWLIKEAWLEARREQPAGEIRIPDNRGELYRSFVTRMLRRDDDRHLNRSVPEEDRLAALERLALALHEQKTLTLPAAQAREIVGGPTTLDALLVNGLLLPVNYQVRFAPHQTLQEHFAARALKDGVMARAKAQGFGRLVNRVRPGVLEYANDPWWAETFIQLAGLTDDSNALARTLAGINPWLAWWCVQEGRAVDDATREAIRAKSEALVRSPDVSDRRRAAQALAQLQTTERVIPALARLAADDDDETGRIASGALQEFGDAARQPLVDILADHTVKPPARARLGRMLSELGDPRPGALAPNGVPDIDWVEIPAGEFIYQNGKRLTLPTFYISRYPVTYAQFQAFLDAPDGFSLGEWWEGLTRGYRHQKMEEQSFKFANHPRDSMSWYQAVAFCRWLSSKTGDEVMLPTEQQWEKAARGTDGREYPWGNDYRSGYANIDETYDIVGPYNLETTTAVGLYPQGASPYGVLDLSGNVWEWCLNEYDNPAQTGLPGDVRRVVRGGAWYIAGLIDYARAVSCFHCHPGYGDHFYGFRVVVASPIFKGFSDH